MNQFKLPYHLIVEAGAFDHIPEKMDDAITGIEKKKMIFVTEENLKGIFEDRIKKICDQFHQSEEYLIQRADYDSAVALAKYITMNDIDLVIGFGGGTVLDLAKFASFVSKTVYISLPTTLSNDSLASPVAVLGTTGKARKSFKCTIPHAIMVDADVIKSAPVRQLLSGIGDTVSKYTALYDWKLAAKKDTERVDDFAYMLSRMAFDSICFFDGGHSEMTENELKTNSFIRLLTQALVMGGLAMEIAGNSRPSSGSEHLFCHALEENFSEEVSIPHGIAVAMGSYPAAIFQGRNHEKIKNVIKQYRIPVRPSDNKLSRDVFIAAWQSASASRADRYTILREADLSDERLGRLYDEMEAIF